MAKRWLAFLWLAVLLLAVGCGGGDEAPAAPTGATSEVGSPTPPSERTAVPTPIITNGRFEDPAKGYSVQIPDGWAAHPNFVPAPLLTDAFFAPNGTEGVQPNIAVLCEELPEGRTLTEHFDAKTEIVRRVAGVEPDVSTRQVGGMEVMVASYGRENSNPPLHKTEVVFVSERCGWSVSLTVPFGQEGEYEPLFERFLASFTLLPP